MKSAFGIRESRLMGGRGDGHQKRVAPLYAEKNRVVSSLP